MLTQGSFLLYSRGGGGISQSLETAEDEQRAKCLKCVCLKCVLRPMRTSHPDKTCSNTYSRRISPEQEQQPAR